jgi:hypothetical protein
MKFINLLLLSIFCASCASTMPGQKLETGTSRVTATKSKNHLFSNKRIQMIQFSMQNNTEEWLEFDGATFEGENGVSVLVGERISSWVEACTLEKEVSDYNTSIILGSIAVAGAVVAGSSHHPQTSTTGAVIALGSIGGLAMRDYQNSKNRVEFQKAFPEKHIFQPFIIPPGKVIQRWIMVENPMEEIFVLKARAKTGEEITFKVEKYKPIDDRTN